MQSSLEDIIHCTICGMSLSVMIYSCISMATIRYKKKSAVNFPAFLINDDIVKWNSTNCVGAAPAHNSVEQG